MFVWAYLYHCPGCDWRKDRHVTEAGGYKVILAPTHDIDAAIEAAEALVKEDGVRSLELCGYFGVSGTQRIINAVSGKVPVGNVMFGAESVFGAAAAFSPPQAS